MKVSFPHMGCVTGYKKLMEKLGHECVMPDPPSQKNNGTLALSIVLSLSVFLLR